MWGHPNPQEDAFRRGVDPSLHHRDENPQSSDNDDSGETTRVPPSVAASDADGTWGERDVGGPVSQRMAMQDFEDLQRELTRQATRSRPNSRAASRASRRSETRNSSFFGRIASRASGRPRPDTRASSRGRARAGSRADGGEDDKSDDDDESTASEDNEFPLEQFMRDGHLEQRTESGESTKKLGVVFKNLTVKGVSNGASFVRTLPEAILGSFGPDLYFNLCKLFPWLRVGGQQGDLRTLLNDFTGVVRDGEMMLVLGRPGSGCSTFLKVIANNRGGYAAVEGDVNYSGISAADADKHYRGEVVYNAEDDQHMPTLTVGQTLRFSLLNKTRKRLRGEVEVIIDALLRMFAIEHTRNTIVGNAYVRGVSGGERKRVSIAEALATKSTIVCWDNSTRGLDASTALDYAKSLRIMTDVSDRTTITTLYQAGEGIYDLMDKVLVIDEGRMLFQGPAGEARQYFIDLGFHAPPRQTTPDFLTSICDPASRQFRPGFEDRCPKTAEELEKAFRSSAAYQKVLADVASYEQHLEDTNHADAKMFKDAVEESKSRTVASRSNYTVSFWKQVLACTRREFWLLWGDKTEIQTKYFTIISNGFLVGSLFYNTPSSTAGAFLRGGVTFMSVIFLGWLQLAELMKAVSGRGIVARHKEYAFYRPSAVNLARALVDLPVLLCQCIVFGIIMYFMAGLDVDAGKFFIYLLFMYTTTICITSLYRMMAALSPSIDDAVRFSGIALNLLIIFAGYAISKPALLGQKIWFGWLYHINPLAYAFEGALSNDFSGRIMECAPGMTVPQGEGISSANQGCAIPGALPGQTSVSGDAYLEASFQYSRSHLWRNFGVIIAFSVLYLTITVLATELISFGGSGGGALVFKKSEKTKQLKQAPADEEKGQTAAVSAASSVSYQPHNSEKNGQIKGLTGSDKVFTWENVRYTVPTPQGPKQLLNDISGYAKPGVMVALMGASGAGKTTLLNTLSQRQRVGVVTGDMLVDGKSLGGDFQRGTGFVEQMDLHDETATIREAIEFSALLRQSRDIPRAEKLEYVDQVLDLLELTEIQDAIIASLGVEHKKRLTIGVELAARPSLLLFLDEPTSGLDAQSAFSIVRFLRKLCMAGQAIICTIHQPSSDLIQEFDQILALNPGGNVIYNGPVGENGSELVKYFAARGVECPPGRNVAEFLLETAIKGGRNAEGKKMRWNDEWRESEENKALQAEIARLKAERIQKVMDHAAASAGSETVTWEFAATTWTQTYELSKRMFVHQWRDPSYLYGRLFVAVVVGIFNGFTFWDLGNTVADMQNRMFTCFLIIMIPATVLNSVLPKFYTNRMLWEAREHPSRIYGWVAFVTAEIVSEIPGSLVAAVLYYVLWYFPTGLPTDAPAAGYVFLMTLLFFLFQSSWGQWICAWAPSFSVISNVLPLFLVSFSMFNGVVVPYSQLNVFWKYWLYYMNPSTYWIHGVLAATLPGTIVRCATEEAAYFSPPSGQTCLEFAGQFVRDAGQGYLMPERGDGLCGYCPYATGDEYLKTLDIVPGEKWRDFGIFLGFCVSNCALVYFFIYTVRVKGYTFGLGPMSDGINKAVGGVKRLFSKRNVSK
ncbi:putative ABC transporter [Cladorrhinum sp. PSN259]|nr:putative ABC transporter [Cladorrhinum sp. PSN259]